MAIKQQGGVFGRNPTFRNVEVEGNLTIDGTLSIGGSVITGLNLQGNWNASTNTPDLTVLTPDAGKFWIVSVAGSTNLGGFTNWTVGDWALYDGSAWQRIEGGTVDLSNAVTGTLAIANGGTGASTASTARTNLGSGAVGDNVFTATTALAAQQAMDTEVGVDVQPYDATILKSADIGVTVEAYDSTILKSADIGVSVQGYDADTAKYDDTTANFTGTLQNGGSNVVVDTDIGVTVEAYDATILKSADIGSTVQGYDADTAKYDDTTANFTGTLQEGGNNVVTANEIGTIASQAANNVDIDGGAIDGTAIGGSSASTGTFTQAVVDNITIDGNTISSTNTDGSIILDANGTGIVDAKDRVRAQIQSGATNNTQPDAITVSNITTGAHAAGLGASLRFEYANSGGGYSGPRISAESLADPFGADLVFYGRYYGDVEGPRVKAITGNLAFPSGQGIDFSATSGTGTSELFDDYEEGTWTPNLGRYTGGSITTTYTTQNGWYKKIGNMVFITMNVTIGTISSQGSSLSYIDGLPFAPARSNDAVGPVSANTGFATVSVETCVANGYPRIYFRNAGRGSSLSSADFSNAGDITLSLAYMTS